MIKKLCLFTHSVLLFLTCSYSIAAVTEFAIQEQADDGVLYPVSGAISSGSQSAEKFISINNQLGHSQTTAAFPQHASVSSPLTEWSYSRGVGTIPNTCPKGYDAAGLLCYKHCAQGYDTVAGVCWQRCPQGFTDHGATCTKWKWFPKTIAKHSYMQKIKGMSCSADKINEAGLCYEPCQPTFLAAGPLCFGLFGGIEDQQQIRQQALEQHAEHIDIENNGIHLDEDELPSLRTDISFNAITCGIDKTGVDDLVNEGGDSLLGDVDAGAWINASLSGTVLLDLNFDAECVEDNDTFTGKMSFYPSVAAKVSTHMFDPVLHNLAGVDLGVMSVSVYELIPFRVYGTAGANIGVDVTLSSIVDKTLPPLLIDDVQHAHRTKIEVLPEQDLWLSVDAYLRVTSLFNFIPDLVQLGAEVQVHVLETELPYVLEEGVEDYAGALQLFRNESLQGTVAAGRGYVDTYLRILGEESPTFGNEADLQWPGEAITESFINTRETRILQ